MGVQTTQGYRGKLVDKLTGIILDQFSDEDIKVSNNVLDLFDLGDIPGTYTQTLTLPGTKVNNAFFEQYFDISVWEPDLFNTNQKVEAYLDFDGFYLVNGYLQLNKVNVLQNKFVDSYEVTLFGIISNFSIDTRASFLTDITSLSAYNHTSSVANITSSWAGGLFNGDIVYPMIEYGNDATDQPNFYFSQVTFLGIDDNESAIVVSDYKPAIRIKKVWDAIFNEFGYTYTGSFWNQPFLDSVYMPLNNDKQVPIYNPSIEGYYQWRLANVSGSSYFLTAYDSSSATNFRMNSQVYDNDGAAALSGNSFTFTSPITSKYDVKLDLAFEVSGTNASFSGMPAWYVDYVSGSTVVNTQVLARLNTYMTTVANSRTRTVQEVFNIKDYLFQTPPLNPGTYTIRIYQLPINYNVYTVKLNPNVDNQCAIEFWRCRQAADFKVLDVPSNMPNGTSGIRVIDFIRSIQKKFNLIIYPDKQNPNQFIVETFNNWYKQGQIKDFNKFINLQDKIEYTPANQLGYRQVRFSDAEDTDYVTTLFKRTNNRVYGESNFYDSGSYYSQGTLDVTSDVIGNGPLTLVPGSVYTGSVATSQQCITYRTTNYSLPPLLTTIVFSYTNCGGSTVSQTLNPQQTVDVCARPDTIVLTSGNGAYFQVDDLGDCSAAPTTGSSQYPMWIPYYIADGRYTPARVLPRLYFYNGLVDSQRYYIEGYFSSTGSVTPLQNFQYPYFDNYSTGSLNGTSSIYPQLDARSLLYNNEQAVWGTTPLESLVSEYWDTYLGLLYNPRTRLVDATAVIGLADYFDLELNDIAEFRGNYYHLRAINDYNLTTGECNIQMLGPIIADTISSVLSGSWAPTSDPCFFNFSASLVPMWSGSGISYGVFPGGGGLHAIQEFPNGEIVISGNFGSYNIPVSGTIQPIEQDLIIVDATGSLLRSASGAVSASALGASSQVGSILNNSFFLMRGGSINAMTASFMVSSSLSEFDATFTSNANGGTVGHLPQQFVPMISGNKDKHYVRTGAFSAKYGTTSFTSGSVIRLHTNPTASNRGTLDTTFSLPTASGQQGTLGFGINNIAVQSDGKLIVSLYQGSSLKASNGTFTIPFSGIARYNTDGTFDTTFNTGSGAAYISKTGSLGPTGKGAEISGIACDSNDNIFIVGYFNRFNSTTDVKGIIKLNSSGTFDSTFNTNIGTGPLTNGSPYSSGSQFTSSQHVQSILVEPGTDKLIVSGIFRSWNGTNVQGLTKLNNDGTLDTTFIPNNTATGSMGLPPGAMASQINSSSSFGGNPTAISIAANGDYLVYGEFNNRGTANFGSGSATPITQMSWNNVSASFGTAGFIPARILRITDSGSFPINGSYII